MRMMREEGRSSNSSSARLVGERAALKTAGERRKEAKEKDDWGSYASVHRPGVSSGPPLLGRSVLVSGLIARPELNGTRGVAVTYNAETGRYNVRMPQGEVIALKPTNLAAATEGSTGFGEAGSAEAKAAAEAKEKERKASIGQRMAAKRNAKGIGWASKSSVSGMFASEGKRQGGCGRRASNPIKEDYDEVCVCVNGTHQQGSSSAHSPPLPPLPFPPSPQMAELEKERVSKLSKEEVELERKANALKDLATQHMQGMDLGRSAAQHTAAAQPPPPPPPPTSHSSALPPCCVCVQGVELPDRRDQVSAKDEGAMVEPRSRLRDGKSSRIPLTLLS